MAFAKEDNTLLYGVAAALGVLLVLSGVVLWILLNTEPAEAKPEPTKTRVVAKADLAAFTPLNEGNIKVVQGTDKTSDADAQKPPTVEELNGRYLMVNVKQGGEVRPEMAVPFQPTLTLNNSVAVSIPATPTSTLGGQLKVGDLIDVYSGTGTPSSATAADQATIRSFENLLVLNIALKKEAKADEKPVGEAGVLTLAVPRDKCVDFAAAVAGGTVMVARRIPAKN